MVKRYIEEALNLSSVQVNSNDTGDSCRFQKVSHQLGCNRLTATGFAVLACIAVIRDDCCDMTGRSTFKSIRHNQKFHNVIINGRATGRLHDENIFAAHALIDHYLYFAVIKAVDNGIANSST